MEPFMKFGTRDAAFTTRIYLFLSSHCQIQFSHAALQSIRTQCISAQSYARFSALLIFGVGAISLDYTTLVRTTTRVVVDVK